MVKLKRTQTGLSKFLSNGFEAGPIVTLPGRPQRLSIHRHLFEPHDSVRSAAVPKPDDTTAT
jgi:hypothetical protein